ncbi:hypothetical protein [Chamaesiphon sp. OTE_75_metabat_556]|uniref:hypothetical protein n=1 Tax=Chamaesiphon sp. OTE_75_metabat_556 TaxID=2964692 RepID=UPI00286C141C|nr:hypothetical protein [Chamaesiphon sp. OTE_75_metabat_556]
MTQIDRTEDSIHMEVSDKLDVADYIFDVPFDDPLQISESHQPLVRDVALQPQVKQEIQDWIAQKREGARGGIAITLIVFFGVSLLAEFLLIGLGAFYPQSNTALIKDTLPLLINSLTAIVSLALAFYFKEK